MIVVLPLLLILMVPLCWTEEAQCKDAYSSYCNRRGKYCTRFRVLREEWCRMTCNNCQLTSEQCQEKSVTNTVSYKFQRNSNEFAIKLHKLVRKEAGQGNVFFSPTSISLILGMILIGANGDTKDQIKEHLAKDLSNDNEILKAYAWLMNELNGKPTQYTLYTANAIFVQQGMRLRQEFALMVTQCFNSTAELRNFTTQYEDIRQEVNEWVESKTNDKIKDLIPKDMVNHLTRMILVNAIYFKGEWLRPFTQGSQTTKRNFYPLNDPGIGKPIDFMNIRSATFPYYENDDLQVLELPYKSHELSMNILLPRERSGLTKLESTLTEQYINKLINSVRNQLIEVSIPKWNITQDVPLKKVLEKMGMTKMFNGSMADFSRITGRPDLFVSGNS